MASMSIRNNLGLSDASGSSAGLQVISVLGGDFKPAHLGGHPKPAM